MSDRPTQLVQELARELNVALHRRDARTVHRQMVTGLKPGQMAVHMPGLVTPEDGDPFIGARSPDGRWRVVAHLFLDSRGTFFIRDLEIMPWDGGPEIPLGTDVLRRLPLGRWLTTAHRRLAELAEKGLQEGRDSEQLRRLAKSKVGPKAGPRGFGRDFYRRLALSYLEMQGKGVSRGIRDALARQESKRQKQTVTPVQIRDALSKCVELGYLTPGTPGRAGRRAGPNLFPGDEHEED